MTKSNTSSPPRLTASQEFAFERLCATARLQFSRPDYGPVKLRTTPLVLGPSGVGKTHLIQAVAKELGLPLMRLTVSNWMIEGVRLDTPTVVRLRREVERGRPFVLQIDELDKLKSSDEAWCRAQQAEVYNVLDRMPGLVTPEGSSGTSNLWRPEQIEFLTHQVFMIGCGTWQEVFENSGSGKGPVGFWSGPRPQSPDAELQTKVRQARMIAPELLNRFSDDWILLQGYTRKDFAQLARDLNLPPTILDPIEAERSGLNYRYLENVLTKAAVDAMIPYRAPRNPMP